MNARNRKEAWDIADKLMPTDYELDLDSIWCDHEVYRSTIKGVEAWINDLGDRLEVNYPVGRGVETVNIWIDDEPPMSVGRFCKSNRNDLVKVLVMEVETGEIYMSGLISDINENYPDYLSPYLTANPYMLEVKSWEFRPNAGELWLLVHAATC